MPLNKTTLSKAFDQYRVIDAFDRSDNLLTPVGAVDPELYGLNLNFAGLGSVSHIGVIGSLDIPEVNIPSLTELLKVNGATDDAVAKHLAGINNPTLCKVIRNNDAAHGSSFDLVLGDSASAPVHAGGGVVPIGQVKISSLSASSLRARRANQGVMSKRTSGYTAADPSMLSGRPFPSVFDEGDRDLLGAHMSTWLTNASTANAFDFSNWQDPLGALPVIDRYSRDFLADVDLFTSTAGAKFKGLLPSSVMPLYSEAYCGIMDGNLNPFAGVEKTSTLPGGSPIWNSHYDEVEAVITAKHGSLLASRGSKVDPSLIALEELAYVEALNAKHHGIRSPRVESSVGNGFSLCPLTLMVARAGYYSKKALDESFSGTITVILPPICVGSSGLVWVSPVYEILGTPALDGVGLLDFSAWSLAFGNSDTLEPCSTLAVGNPSQIGISNSVNLGTMQAASLDVYNPMFNCLSTSQVAIGLAVNSGLVFGSGMKTAAKAMTLDTIDLYASGYADASLIGGSLFGVDNVGILDCGSSYNSDSLLSILSNQTVKPAPVSRSGDTLNITAVKGSSPAMGLHFSKVGLSGGVGAFPYGGVNQLPRLSSFLGTVYTEGSVTDLWDEWSLLTVNGARFQNYSALSGILSSEPVLSMFTLPRIDGHMTLKCRDAVFERDAYASGNRYSLASFTVLSAEGSLSLAELINLMSDVGTTARVNDTKLDSDLMEAETYKTENAAARLRFSWRSAGFGLDVTDCFYKTRFYDKMFKGKAAPASMSDVLLPADNDRAAVTFKQALNRANANKTATLYAMVDDPTIYGTGLTQANPLIGSPSSLRFELTAGLRSSDTVKGVAGTGIIWVKPIKTVDGSLEVNLFEEMYSMKGVPTTDNLWAQYFDLNHESIGTIVSQYFAAGYNLTIDSSALFPTAPEGIAFFLSQLWEGVTDINSLMTQFPELAGINANFDVEDADLNPTKLVGNNWYPSFDNSDNDEAQRLHFMLKGVDMSKVERLVSQYMFYSI